MIRRIAVTLGLGAVLCCAAFAYEYPLSSTAIRDAYFLGKGSGARLAAFRTQYIRTLALPKQAAYAATIELDTPFAGVVERARTTPDYYTPDAVEEFLGKPGVFRARLNIYLTPTYAQTFKSKNGELHSLAPNFWRDFKIVLSQEEKPIKPDSVHGEPIFAAKGEMGGAIVDLAYRAEKIVSEPVTFTLTTPQGQKAEVTFDLARLK